VFVHKMLGVKATNFRL